MTEEQKQPKADAQPPAQPKEKISKEVEEGRPLAILSYALTILMFPFFLIPLFIRQNDFALYHAKQCLILWIFLVVGMYITAPLILVCVGTVLAPIVFIIFLVLAIMGLMNAVKYKKEPVPLLGQYAVDWFKGITKA